MGRRLRAAHGRLIREGWTAPSDLHGVIRNPDLHGLIRTA